MWFLTDGNSSAGGSVDSGFGGFLNTGVSNPVSAAVAEGSAGGSAGTSPDTTSAESGQSQGSDSAAGSSSQDAAQSRGQAMSPEELVATRIAQSMIADGFDVSQLDQGGADTGDGGDGDGAGDGDGPQVIDISQLSEAELRALAERAIELEKTAAAADDERATEAVRTKVEEAEADAVAQVIQQFEEAVLKPSRTHFGGKLAQSVATVLRDAKSQDNPDRYIVREVLRAAFTTFEEKNAYEAAQAEDWDERARQAALAARKRVPELRSAYAQKLVRDNGLPAKAVEAILKRSDGSDRNIDDFADRARELTGLAEFAGRERAKGRQQQQQDANRSLRENPVGTTPAARQPGGTPPEYKGTVGEGLAILSLMHAAH